MNKIKVEEFTALLKESFPEFTVQAKDKYYLDEEDWELNYQVTGAFAHYLLDQYHLGKKDTLVNSGIFIEKLYEEGDSEGDDNIITLATVGMLEGIQNVWGNSNVNSSKYEQYLQPISRKWWEKLNLFWDEGKLLG